MAAGDPVVAVRSSASNEDGALASAAGQHDSFLGVQGIDAVVEAVRACRASLWSDRATAYRKNVPTPAMAVIIQLHVDADVSGVLFTSLDGSTLIESSWGLGPSVVEGRVTPDRYEVHNGHVTRTIADKPTALIREGTRLVTHQVPADQRRTPTLPDATAVHLAALAHQATTAFGAPQDIEWAIASNTIWFLQSRPITTHPPTPPNPTPPTSPPPSAPLKPPAPLTPPAPRTPPVPPAPLTPPAPRAEPAPRTPPVPAAPLTSSTPPAPRTPPAPPAPRTPPAPPAPRTPPVPPVPLVLPALSGTPASRGVASGPARVVRGPGDFASVRPGDVLVCPQTDPAWTPLLSIAAGVVTETGGVLSHAAIVARERGIPAVVAVPHATERIPTGAGITIDGSTGAVQLTSASET
ncbi:MULTISPECIES: PEP/pyruvate-binding domain-containing protein [Kribbella]|uniref:PEP/pyruvate-binding domain-containing protein n=1 Tax=Kribbella TaxID=182639 RepID=UPI0031DA8D4C